MTNVRSRFAPSPTGDLHIGGARTALFALLAARQLGGAFVLRIDDTDRQRSTVTFLEDILGSMRWLDLGWDEGPYFQSERFEKYRAAAEDLLAKGRVYRCYCTPEELDAKREGARAAGRNPAYDRTCRDYHAEPADPRPYTLRFRTPIDGETKIDDIIKGRIEFRNEQLDDLILVRSDGTPTYNFCSAFDDADIAISHVVRGEDHLTNTARQVLLFQALEASVPRFAHLPLIFGPDRTPLSKRAGATAVRAYREAGYLPDALINFLARLGWASGDDEIFSRAMLEEKFRLEDVGTSAGVFNPEKLQWLNAMYLKERPPAQLAREVRPFLPETGHSVPDDEYLARMVTTLQPRAKTLVDLAEQATFYLVDEVALEAEAKRKFLSNESLTLLATLRGQLDGLTAWDEDSLHRIFVGLVEAQQLKLGRLAQPVRVALTGRTASPGIFEVMSVLGKARTLARLDRVLAGC